MIRRNCEHQGCGKAGVRLILVDAGPLGRFPAWACKHHAEQPTPAPLLSLLL